MGDGSEEVSLSLLVEEGGGEWRDRVVLSVALVGADDDAESDRE